MKKNNTGGKLKISQIGSANGVVKKTQLATLKGLGLGRIGKQSVLLDNDCTRGMIKKVSHLVSVEVME